MSGGRSNVQRPKHRDAAVALAAPRLAWTERMSVSFQCGLCPGGEIGAGDPGFALFVPLVWTAVGQKCPDLTSFAVQFSGQFWNGVSHPEQTGESCDQCTREFDPCFSVGHVLDSSLDGLIV